MESNMSKLSITAYALIASLFISTDACASESASAALGVRGTSLPVCQMLDPIVTSKTNATISNKSITVDNLISQQDATILAWDATMTFPRSMCNYSASVSLQSQYGGMKPTGSVGAVLAGDFMKQVNYTATARWGSVPQLILNTATSGTNAVSQLASGANQADLIVTISTPPSSAPLVAGDFQDNLIVKVGLSF
jgi:hypothetical protein